MEKTKLQNKQEEPMTEGTDAYLHRIRHAVVCIVTDLSEKILTQLEGEK